MSHLIREFILVIGSSRKMFGEQIACFADDADDAAGELGIAEVIGHFSRQHAPELLPTSRMDSCVTNHRELARFRSDEDQNPVTLAGLFHAHLDKVRLSCSHRVVHRLAAHEDADLSGGLTFRRLNGRHDFLVPQAR